MKRLFTRLIFAISEKNFHAEYLNTFVNHRIHLPITIFTFYSKNSFTKGLYRELKVS